MNAVAVELGVNPAFVEKDWHAVRLVRLLAATAHESVRPVFSGGTSLSKGYGLIQRFSEDLDFKTLLPEGGVSRSVRSTYRRRLVEAIRASDGWRLEDGAIQAGNESRFFSCEIGYDSDHSPAPALRPFVRLEMTMSNPALPPKTRSVRSFVAQARGDDPEVAAIACVSPVETAADKLSALTWRVLVRQRGEEGDDPTLVRHLHDLAALAELAVAHSAFPELSAGLLDKDSTRGSFRSEAVAMSSVDRLSKALGLLVSDREYRNEYERFVRGVSYADDADVPSFETALERVHRLVTVIK